MQLSKPRVRFLSRPEVASFFVGKTVAIVGSGPGVLENNEGFIDEHDVVLRVNNYKLSVATGKRCDVFYSFFGNSIRKTALELRTDGVKLCICKCPDAHAIESEWHRRNDKMLGVDFRWIYRDRKMFWFCDTYVPTTEEFLAYFNLLDGHVPTTGFAAIQDVISFNPKSMYLTGFDFFLSGIHNVNQKWKRVNHRDPIGHEPERELEWLTKNFRKYPITMDKTLVKLMGRLT
jgi:hypothetical protein